MEKTQKFGLFLLILSGVSETCNGSVKTSETTLTYNYTIYHTMDELGLENQMGNEKKAIWMDCGIHPQERIGPAFCQWFVKEIVNSYKTDEKWKQMLQNLDVYVTPVVNVDGYMFTWTNDSTRSASPQRSGCFCVDLNGNFYVTWGTFDASNHCGTPAGSEPEVKAVMDFVGQIANQTLCFLTINSAGQFILLPYGHPEITAPNHKELLSAGEAAAAKMNGMKYTVETSSEILNVTSGSSCDWARLIGIPYSYTFGLRDNSESGNLLPEDQIKGAFQGVRSIITYVHDQNFNAAVTLVSAFTVSGVAVMISSNIMAVFLTTGVLV